MIDWIIKNIEFLFGGIGIVLFVYSIKFIYWLINKNRRAEQIERIAQKYLDIVDGRIRGHSGVTGLIESGAAQLSKNKQLLQVCEKIVLRGVPNPLNYWVHKYIKKRHSLKFIKWQAKNNIGYSPYYFNENNFNELIQKFKNK